MIDSSATRILVGAAEALARTDDLSSSLGLLLDTITGQLNIASGAIFAAEAANGSLTLAATSGLDDVSARGLATAVTNPVHPITRSYAEPTISFNVRPTAPGGPALRSHLPLVVHRDGTDRVLGVLALAHAKPIESDARPVLEASAQLVAVALERARAR